MKIRYLVCYDISDSKRLQKVHRKMRGYGEALQYSVFCCDLTASEKTILWSELHTLINHREDQILFVNLGNSMSQRAENLETLGRALSIREQQLAVIV
ncbi:MAG: CRISPR-associated endonuclease Cas2 [Pyrinomonadaceae bacterium]